MLKIYDSPHLEVIELDFENLQAVEVPLTPPFRRVFRRLLMITSSFPLTCSNS